MKHRLGQLERQRRSDQLKIITYKNSSNISI